MVSERFWPIRLSNASMSKRYTSSGRLTVIDGICRLADLNGPRACRGGPLLGLPRRFSGPDPVLGRRHAPGVSERWEATRSLLARRAGLHPPPAKHATRRLFLTLLTKETGWISGVFSVIYIYTLTFQRWQEHGDTFGKARPTGISWEEVAEILSKHVRPLARQILELSADLSSVQAQVASLRGKAMVQAREQGRTAAQDLLSSATANDPELAALNQLLGGRGALDVTTLFRAFPGLAPASANPNGSGRDFGAAGRLQLHPGAAHPVRVEHNVHPAGDSDHAAHVPGPGGPQPPGQPGPRTGRVREDIQEVV